MKKVIMTMVVALGLMLTSCADKEQKAIDIVKDATEQIKEAKSAEEIEKINNEATEEIDALGFTDEEEDVLQKNPEMQEAFSNYIQASFDKAMELSGM